MTPSPVSAPRTRLLIEARRARWPALVLILYSVLHQIFATLTERGGLLSPAGDISLRVALVGVVVIPLRLVVLFVLPAWVGYRVSRSLLGWRAPDAAGRGSEPR